MHLWERFQLIFSLRLNLVDEEEDALPDDSPIKNLRASTGVGLNTSRFPASAFSNLPLILVISEHVPADLVDCLVSVLKRGSTLIVEPYKLLLPNQKPIHNKELPNQKPTHNKEVQVVQLLCIGFDSSQLQFGGETHTKAQERRNLYSFLQSISIDGTTSEGGHLWSWVDHTTEEQDTQGQTDLRIPSPNNPSSMLDVCLKKNIISRLYFRHHDKARHQLNATWSEQWSPIYMTPHLSKQACSYLGPEIALYFEFLTFYTRALLVPTCVGIFFYWFGSVTNAQWWIALSLATAVWSSIFVGWWSRYKIDVSNRWVKQNVGMYTNNSRIDDLSLATVTSEVASKAAREAGDQTHGQTIVWRRCASVCVSFLLLFVVLRVDYYLLAWKTSNDKWLEQQEQQPSAGGEEAKTEEMHFLFALYYSMIPTVAKAFCIHIFGVLFSKITLMQGK